MNVNSCDSILSVVKSYHRPSLTLIEIMEGENSFYSLNEITKQKKWKWFL